MKTNHQRDFVGPTEGKTGFYDRADRSFKHFSSRGRRANERKILAKITRDPSIAEDVSFALTGEVEDPWSWD